MAKIFPVVVKKVQSGTAVVVWDPTVTFPPSVMVAGSVPEIDVIANSVSVTAAATVPEIDATLDPVAVALTASVEIDPLLNAVPLALAATVPEVDVNLTTNSVAASIGVTVVQDFTTTDSWVCPTGVTSVKVECWGGGGGGGAAGASGGGGGGGGGGYGSLNAFASTPGASYVVTVGTGGAVSNDGKASTFGINTLSLPGTSGNYASSPDSAPLSVTGDFEIRMLGVALTDWTPATVTALCSKWVASGTFSYIFYVATNGQLVLGISPNGTTATDVYGSTINNSFTNGSLQYLRVTRRSSDGRIQFFTSSDGGSTWTQFGTNVTGITGAISDNTSGLEIGSDAGGTGALANGTFNRVQIRNNILDDGTGIVFDARFDKVISTGTRTPATLTESSTNAATVTVNGSAWSWSSTSSVNGNGGLQGLVGTTSQGAGGAGGTGTGDVSHTGGAGGGNGGLGTTNGGGGGGGAGSTGNGQPAAGQSGGSGTNINGGAGGSGGQTITPATPGSNDGGGGGGASTLAAGAGGARGEVILTYTLV